MCCQARNLQILTHQFQHTHIHLDKCGMSSTPAQGLYADTSCACKKVQKTRTFYAYSKNIKKCRLHAIHDRAGTDCFGGLQLASLSLTSYYTHGNSSCQNGLWWCMVRLYQSYHESDTLHHGFDSLEWISYLICPLEISCLLCKPEKVETRDVC